MKNIHDLNFVPAWKMLDEKMGTQVSNPYAENDRPEIDRLFTHPPNRILDIGCSTGCVGYRLKKKQPETFVWGVEIGASAHEAEKKLNKVSKKNLFDFNEEEVQMLSTVDTVFLLDVLEHMYDPWRTLCFLAANLNPDTQIIVSLPNIGHLNVLRDLSNDYWLYQDSGLLDVTHVRFFTHYEMKRMFYETGFKIIKSSFQLGATNFNKNLSSKDFPLWIDFDEIKIKVNNYEHYVKLNSRQIIFNIKKSTSANLSESEVHFLNSPHPAVLAF